MLTGQCKYTTKLGADTVTINIKLFSVEFLKKLAEIFYYEFLAKSQLVGLVNIAMRITVYNECHDSVFLCSWFRWEVDGNIHIKN